ncbi:hypothetical protein L6452_03932 [Arctium lappa]|uniref:Uncharacterized protein n=1 Tax=Arctium lappa TaxID=4217 RepID=A0ACB9FN91_ARCLA|nr:hypothetical protein L6452_03932 [Arctium lappa]
MNLFLVQMKKSKLFLVQMKKLNMFLVESSDGKDEIEQRWWSSSALDNGGATMESYGVWKERWGRCDLMRRLCFGTEVNDRRNQETEKDIALADCCRC